MNDLQILLAALFVSAAGLNAIANWLKVPYPIPLVLGGLLGFLPVLGFWMIPLGLLVLSIDIPIVRRWRRQLAVWWHRDRKDDKAEARTPTPARKSKVG